MQQHRDSLSAQALEDLGESGPRRKRFAELVYERDGFDTRRRANGRVCQWRNEDDNHRLPFDHAKTLIEACDGEVSWLDDLNLFAAECRSNAGRRRMAMVRHDEESKRTA